MLNRTKNTQLRKAILEYTDADLISALCECAHNILRGTVRLTPREKVRLRKHKNKLRLIANKRLSITKRRRAIQRNGGFLPALLAPLATTVFLPLQKLLKEHGVYHFVTHNEETKASIVERFNRTLKTRMWRYFTKHQSVRYIDVLHAFMRSYNNTYHRSIGMAPSEVTSANQ